MIIQRNRKNPHRPTVSPAVTSTQLWWAQGVDSNGKYHCSLEYSIEAAHNVATGWAANGYPKKGSK